MAATAEPKAEGLDMDLYSRQIGAFGLETMAKLTQMRVLIVGMGGVGVEIAKNICLAGPKRVTILDANIAEVKDMGSNFFISAEDLGSRRGASLRLLPPPLRPACGAFSRPRSISLTQPGHTRTFFFRRDLRPEAL